MYSQTLDNMKLTASKYMCMDYILIAEYSTNSRREILLKNTTSVTRHN